MRCHTRARYLASSDSVFSQLPPRFPGMRLAVPAEQLRVRADALTGGLTQLPVEW